MSVYVDKPIHPYRRMLMCHMFADSIDELHAMADKIGIARRWYQGPPVTDMPHYDICKAKRSLAVRYGAIEVGQREMYYAWQRLRGAPAS